MIPNEIIVKYNMITLEEYKTDFGDTADTEKMFYETFLNQTDHIPNKIVESLIENLADATILNFIEMFINFLKDVRVEYKDVLQYRKAAREEINKLNL